jgi:hypothetical protein
MHVIFMPPVHFSSFILQRGIMAMFMGIMPVIGMPMPMFGVTMPGIPIVVGFTIVLIMITLSLTDAFLPGGLSAGRALAEKRDVQGTG